MVTPNRLRYIECELPNGLLNSLTAFEDEFDAQIKPYFDRLAFLEVSELPGLNAALAEQIELRKQLLEGSPVPGFGSLEALEENLKLSNPDRDQSSPEVIRNDERKLGAFALLLLNGKLYRILKGRRVEAFRLLWKAAGYNFSAFVNLAEAILSQQRGTMMFLQHNTAKPTNAPYVNRSFEEIYNLSGYKPSLYKNCVFWNNEITPSTANRLKLDACGFTATQVSNMMAGYSPNEGVNLRTNFREVLRLLGGLAKLFILPRTDAFRQPPWQSESDLMELILQTYFEYRLLKNISSSVLDGQFYSLMMQNLTPADLKELFENRPEITDFELPQQLDVLTDAVNTAISVPAGSAIINTYMLKLPDEGKLLRQFECRLFDVGLALWRVLIKKLPERAKTLEPMLQELIGDNAALTPLTPFCVPDEELSTDDIFKALGGKSDLTAAGALKDLMNIIATSDDPDDKTLIDKALAASASGSTTATKQDNEEKRAESKQAGETNGGAGTLQGRPTEETAAMLLARRTRWQDNFAGCGSISNEFNPAKAGQTEIIDSRTGRTLASTTNSPEEIVDKDLGTQQVKIKGKSYVSVLVPETVASYEVTVRSDDHGLNEGTSIHIYEAPSSSLLGKFYPKVPDKNTLTIKVEGSPAPGSGVLSYEYLPRINESNYSAEMRRTVVRNQGRPNTLNSKLELDLTKCSGGVFDSMSKWLESRRKSLEKWLEQIIDIIRQVIITIQDKIDAFILQFQLAIDMILSKLEKLLSLDLNLSAAGGFENSIIKCTFGIDLSLKINLLDLLLKKLQEFMPKISFPIQKFLGLIREFLTNIFCIPIKWLESLLGKEDKKLEDLAELTNGMVSCSIKDFQLPQPIFELLRLLNGLFSIRGLVLRQANADWWSKSLQGRAQTQAFSGLSQFARICQSSSKTKLLKQMADIAELAGFGLPIRQSSIQYQSGKQSVAAMAGVSGLA